MSSELPTVSIVVSAYQNIGYLPATIESILQQTYDNFEIIIFSDDYHQIYPWFKRSPDCRLRFVLQSNLGLATTLNQGILEARGKYISLIEPGDLWHPSKLQKQIFCLDRYPQVDLIHSPSVSISRHPSALDAEPAIDTNRGKCSSIGDWNLEILAHNQLVFASVMLRRSCFEKVGLFDPELQMTPDWEMWIRLSHHSEFIALAEPLVYCRQLQENWRGSCLKVETDLQITIEKAYALLPEDREKHKHRSYGYASLYLAKHMLQQKNPDPAIAHNYWYQALEHDPLIVFSVEFCQLRWIIFNLYCLQSDRYRHLEQLFQVTSDLLKVFIHAIKEHSQKIVNWMLEEEDSVNFWKNRKVKQQGKD